jgi:hypothetical protein
VYGAGLYSFFRNYNTCSSAFFISPSSHLLVLCPLYPSSHPLFALPQSGFLPFRFSIRKLPLTRLLPACSDAGNGETCQTQIFGIDTGGPYSPGTEPQTSQSSMYVYNLNTIGATSMVEKDGVSLATFSDNNNMYPDTMAVFRSLSGSS